jgi:hypothetical protein
MLVKWASSTWQTDIVSAATKQKGKEEGEDEWNLYCSEEECKQFTKISNHYKLFLKIMSIV